MLHWEYLHLHQVLWVQRQELTCCILTSKCVVPRPALLGSGQRMASWRTSIRSAVLASMDIKFFCIFPLWRSLPVGSGSILCCVCSYVIWFTVVKLLYYAGNILEHLKKNLIKYQTWSKNTCIQSGDANHMPLNIKEFSCTLHSLAFSQSGSRPAGLGEALRRAWGRKQAGGSKAHRKGSEQAHLTKSSWTEW